MAPHCAKCGADNRILDGDDNHICDMAATAEPYSEGFPGDFATVSIPGGVLL